MRVGISCYDHTATDFVALARAAEQAGFDSVWLGEHVVAPLTYGSHHPTQAGSETESGSADHHGKPIVGLDVELLDPVAALAAAGAVTTHLNVSTGIYLLPLRHPLLTARATATLHDLTDGRLRLGIGAGWLVEEFASLGVPHIGRTARLEEAVHILRLAWAGGPFEFYGEHYQIDKVQVSGHPTPVPIIMGGNSEPALKRAVRLGDGWFSSGIPEFADALRLRDDLDRFIAETGRTTPFEMTFRMPVASGESLAKYRSEGFTDVLVMDYDVWTGSTPEERVSRMGEVAADLGLERRD